MNKNISNMGLKEKFSKKDKVGKTETVKNELHEEYNEDKRQVLGHAKRIKQLIFPPAGSLFWGLVVLSTVLECIPLLGLCGIIVLIDSLKKFSKIRRKDIPIKFSCMILAVLRSYLAFFYHCCAFVSRYYLFSFILILPLVPLASMIILGMHFLTGIVEYFIKKPSLNPLSFLFYFSFEQISYQLGVWWACLKEFIFSPVNPQIVRKSVLNKE